MIGFSVVIPALNEAQAISSCIAGIRSLDPDVEIIVADGGSADATVQLAEKAEAVVCCAPRGRGPQCNAGAARSSGDVLLFLHADTTLPPNAFDLLRGLFQDEQVQIAKFQLSFDTDDWLLEFVARCMWIDSTFTSYGDQCIVVRRSFFEAIGGFPNWPLFEDVRLFETSRWRTHVHVVPAQVTTSARRFVQNGVAQQLAADLWHITQYLVGVPPQRIAARYERARPQPQIDDGER